MSLLCIMMHRCMINKQSGIQMLRNCHYQDILVSPFNKPSDLLFILSVYGGNEYGKSCHLSTFTSLKHLMMLLMYNCQGFTFTPYQRYHNRDMPLRFKVETLLKSDFNAPPPLHSHRIRGYLYMLVPHQI